MKKKEKKHGSTAPAAALMVVLIGISIPLGVNRTFDRLQEEVQNEYYYDSTGYAIWEGVDDCESIAKNLLTVAENYKEQYPQLTKPIAELEHCVQVSEHTYEMDDESFASIVSAYTGVTQAAHTLYDALQEVELAEKDEKYPRQLIAELDSECDKISRSSYNDEAQAYNEKLSMFPASELRKIAKVDYMATFNDTENYAVPILAEGSADLTE